MEIVLTLLSSIDLFDSLGLWMVFRFVLFCFFSDLEGKCLRVKYLCLI